MLSRLRSSLASWSKRAIGAGSSSTARGVDPRHALGSRGEGIAAEFLEAKGYRLLKQNVRIPGGEIDLIVESPDKTVVFVEVKTRGDDRYPGELAINRTKRRRMIQLTQRIARRFNWAHRKLRIDVVVVVWSGHEEIEPVIRHHPNAITL